MSGTVTSRFDVEVAGVPEQHSYLPAHEREKQIVNAAIAFAAQHGFNFTTRELAEKMGITQPLLYRYFKNRQALIDRIFQEVYLSRWQPGWNDLLQDRTRPLLHRLVSYLRVYLKAILDEKWIRIFLISSFDDPEISQRYIAMLHDQTFRIILDEIAHETSGMVPSAPEKLELAREVIWSFH